MASSPMGVASSTSLVKRFGTSVVQAPLSVRAVGTLNGPGSALPSYPSTPRLLPVPLRPPSSYSTHTHPPKNGPPCIPSHHPNHISSSSTLWGPPLEHRLPLSPPQHTSYPNPHHQPSHSSRLGEVHPFSVAVTLSRRLPPPDSGQSRRLRYWTQTCPESGVCRRRLCPESGVCP